MIGRLLGGLAGLMALVAVAPAGAETIRVEIRNLAFAPVQVTAHAGDVVEWVNDDFVAHSATARDKSWDVTVPAHGHVQVALRRAGTIDYFCRFHPNMIGHITIQP